MRCFDTPHPVLSPMEIDLEQIAPAVRQRMDELFRKDYDLSVLKAIARQTATAKARQNGVGWRSDLGPQTSEIDTFIDSIWSQEYGHNYRENADLMRFLKRRNPEIDIKARPGKTQVGYEGKAPQPKRPVRVARTGCKFGPGTLALP